MLCYYRYCPEETDGDEIKYCSPGCYEMDVLGYRIPVLMTSEEYNNKDTEEE